MPFNNYHTVLQFASLSYVVMLIASWLFIDQNITPVHLLGSIVVGLGAFLISES